MTKKIFFLVCLLFAKYSLLSQTVGTSAQKACVPPPIPTTIVTQPSCIIPTGTIQVTSPMSSVGTATNLFISEVTDEDVGSLTYVEIYNGTGLSVNLSNYRLKVYNNGNAFTSCDFLLSGTLVNNSTYVISVGSVVNQGGVVPNLVMSSCGGVNIDDNIRLTTSADVEIDLWGRKDGVAFTPINQPGYTYRRLANAVVPKTTWNPADWTVLDPQDYTNVGSYSFLSADYEYSIDATTFQSSPFFTGLAPGDYYVTVRDKITGCTSISVKLTINPIPAAPAAPTASVTIQPTCITTTGTIVITAPIGAPFEYSINGSTYQGGTNFTGLAPGPYNVTVRDTGTSCVSSATTLTVNPTPAAPVAPTASVIVQPTCTTPTGTIVVTAPTGATLEYSINGLAYQAGTTFAGLAPGPYNVTVRDTGSGCVSSPTTLTVNPIPAAPVAPTASVTVQPTCATPTGTIVVTAPIGSTLEYSINGVAYQVGTNFSGLTPGPYNVTVRDTGSGCVSSATALTVNPIPAAPVAPTASVTTQPTCTTPLGTIVITAPTGATLEYSIDGLTYQSAVTFIDVATGTYNATVRDMSTGCVSTSTSLTVNPVPTPDAVLIEEGCIVGAYTLTATPFDATSNYEWFDQANASIGNSHTLIVNNTGVYSVTVTSVEGCISQKSITVSTTLCEIPRGISPNGDTLNDDFDLTGLNVQQLIIYNRYGTEVYSHGANYTNQWFGQSKNNQELPDGTYYYVIVKGDGQSKTGWVYINREHK